MTKGKWIGFVIVSVIICALFVVFLVKGKEDKTKLSDGEWEITQYGSDEGQFMFYTMKDNQGHLVIVDGGIVSETDEVYQVIKQNQLHVDAWIITHLHPDHVGAFNTIMTSPEGKSIVVDQIYTPYVDGERYKITAHDYDGYEFYEQFHQITDGWTNISYLKEGDSFQVANLNFNVIHAWDDYVAKEDHAVLNYGSLMFRVDGKNSNFLFCADVMAIMEPDIVPKHKDELNVDYVQCGHHGNWGMSLDFYDIVDPREAFMDAPDWIIDNRDSNFDGYLTLEYFQKKGVKVNRFANAPNTVVMK